MRIDRGGPACRITRRWSGPRRRYTSLAVERRACAAAAAQRHYVSGHMALHPEEEATLRTFVAAGRRSRLLTLFGSPKRRKQAPGELNHFADWDTRFAQPVDSATDVLSLLRKAGAPAHCHVISDSPELDGRDMPLDEAVSECESYSFASLLCCVPGELAFFFDETWAPRNRVLLRRPGGAR